MTNRLRIRLTLCFLAAGFFPAINQNTSFAQVTPIKGAISDKPKAQAPPVKAPKAVPPAFSFFQAPILKLKFDGENISYTQRTFVADKNDPKPVAKQIPQTYTVNVPFTVTVNGKTETRMRTETRTRMVTTMQAKGEYKNMVMRLPKGVSFTTLDGKPIGEDKLLVKVGFKETPVLLMSKGQKIPEMWKQLLKPDALVLWHEKPLPGQNMFTPGAASFGRPDRFTIPTRGSFLPSP